MEDPAQHEFPSPQEFFTKAPLYAEYSFSDRLQILAIEFFQETIDTYCTECKRDSVFKSDTEIPKVMSSASGNQWIRPNSLEGIPETGSILNEERDKLFWPRNIHSPSTAKISDYVLSDRFFIVRFHCTRIASHHIHYCCMVRGSTLAKIGQYPSLADVEAAGLQKYRKVLSEEKYSELNRAVGLTTHGVGIGAFVYLRRIFEDLIEEARVAAAATVSSWHDDEFEKGHVDDRILMLKAYLPGFLVENRKLYGILSMGIHELTEGECLKHFGLVRLAIELILDEKLRKKDTEIKVGEAGDALTKLKAELDNK